MMFSTKGINYKKIECRRFRDVIDLNSWLGGCPYEIEIINIQDVNFMEGRILNVNFMEVRILMYYYGPEAMKAEDRDY